MSNEYCEVCFSPIQMNETVHMHSGHVTCAKCAAKAKAGVMSSIGRAFHSLFAFFTL
jgi:hypothetical protein